MRALDRLGMNENWTYEAIISSIGETGPHAAPFGVKKRSSNCVEIEVYKGSNTLNNILTNGEFVVNLVVDPVIFYNTLFAKKKIRYCPSKKIKTSVICEAPASIEAIVIDAMDMKQKMLIKAKVAHIHLHDKREWINRAKNLLFESLILSTRIAQLPEGKAEALIRENYRVVRKVAPGSEYELSMGKLLKKIFSSSLN